MTVSHFFEVASVEHPRLLSVLIDEAAERSVPISRVSQGSGSYALTDAELEAMVALAHEHHIQLFTFVNARNGAAARVANGALWGEAAFADAVDELHRCVTFGVDGVLIGDVGLLECAGDLVRSGAIGNLKLKSAAAIAPRNAATASLYVRLGATSINVSSESSFEDLSAMREAIGSEVTLDVYVESPDDFGGATRYRELPRLVHELAPVSLKIGLRNAPTLYPYGQHLEPTATMTIKEKVRRAEIVQARLRDARVLEVPTR
jgi:peptidase U32-like protein